jgi:hypothetical protein
MAVSPPPHHHRRRRRVTTKSRCHRPPRRQVTLGQVASLAFARADSIGFISSAVSCFMAEEPSQRFVRIQRLSAPSEGLARSLAAQLRHQLTSPSHGPVPARHPADLRHLGPAPVHSGGRPQGRVRARVPHQALQLHPDHLPSACRPPRRPALRPHRLLTTEVAARMGCAVRHGWCSSRCAARPGQVCEVACDGLAGRGAARARAGPLHGTTRLRGGAQRGVAR